MKITLILRYSLGVVMIVFWACNSPENEPDEPDIEFPEEMLVEDEMAMPLDSTQENPFLYVALPDSVKEKLRKQLEPNKDGLTPINWIMLRDVDLIQKYSEKFQINYLHPNFGDIVQSLEGRKVFLTGYVLPIDPVYIVLSANPMSQCFFCGNSGPESLLRLMFKNHDIPKKFKMDEFMAFSGTLKLNAGNVEELMYILEDAKIYEVY